MSHIRSRKHHPARIAALVAATFSMTAFAAEEAAQLPEVAVKSKKEVAPFKADTSANTKFTKPLIDTPQTVQIIKKELLTEQGVFTLVDALRNTPGITIQQGENGNSSTGDTFSMRGFNASNQLFVDGIRDLGAVSRDIFNTEQVEVVKGPAGADIGRGAASGYINLITKLPTLTNSNYATVGYGTAQRKRVTVDLNQALSDTIAVRLNGLITEGNVPKRDEVDNQNFSIAPSIAFGLGTDARGYFYSQHIRQDNTPDGGISTIGMSGFYNANAAINAGPKVDRENFYGSKNDYERIDADMLTAKLEYDLSDKTTIRNITRYGQSSIDRVLTGVNGITAVNPANPNTWTLARSRQRVDRDDEILINQTSLNSIFDLAGFKNSFTGGVEFIYERQKSKGYGTAATTTSGVVYTATVNPNANLYTPNDSDPLGKPYANHADVDGRTSTMAVYAFDTIDLNDQWQVNGGVRFERYDTRATGASVLPTGNPVPAITTLTPFNLSDSDNLASYKAGVLYKPATNGSVYLAYGSSYTPPASANFALSGTANNQNNAALDPQKTDNYELGTKWDLLNKQLNVSAALFRTENDKQTSFDDLGNPAQSGKTRVSGYELFAVGQITENWQISTGFTKLNAKALEQQSNVGVNTNAVRWVPNYSATLWTQYSWNDFSIGGGARYMGEQKRLVTTNTPASLNNMPEIPSYTVFDAMVAYAVNQNVNLRLNVYNLFDKEYINTMNNSGARVQLGLARSAMATAEIKF
ncbi:catecholate siderophore receptor Fiu [Methylophilus sp. Leaf414]|uniref:catecholate siderophore receptor Fiu n=1 Tax=Methylophilus sp. Leaf414 TaxID=1736371 RepID=UPI0006F8905A|nr:catecholate siderophore receptor Fiu [Methylophilus sp. Leaf414]KQT36200.1 TonB-dependent receptor [Methylophilus sp. Leaf414]